MGGVLDSRLVVWGRGGQNVLSMDKVSGEEFQGDDGRGCLA